MIVASSHLVYDTVNEYRGDGKEAFINLRLYIYVDLYITV